MGKTSQDKHGVKQKNWKNKDKELHRIDEEDSGGEDPANDAHLNKDQQNKKYDETSREKKYQFLDNVVLGEYKWDKIQSLVHMANFKESLWYGNLSKMDLIKLEMCIQIQQEINGQAKQEMDSNTQGPKIDKHFKTRRTSPSKSKRINEYDAIK